MPEPVSVAVPLDTLRDLLRLVREGISPRIHWCEASARMHERAMSRRSEIFAELETELETLIPETLR